jgi:hypothetical protein
LICAIPLPSLPSDHFNRLSFCYKLILTFLIPPPSLFSLLFRFFVDLYMAAYLSAFTSGSFIGQYNELSPPKVSLKICARIPSNMGYVSAKFSDIQVVWEFWDLISEPIIEKYMPMKLILECLISHTDKLEAAHNAG